MCLILHRFLRYDKEKIKLRFGYDKGPWAIGENKRHENEILIFKKEKVMKNLKRWINLVLTMALVLASTLSTSWAQVERKPAVLTYHQTQKLVDRLNQMDHFSDLIDTYLNYPLTKVEQQYLKSLKLTIGQMPLPKFTARSHLIRTHFEGEFILLDFSKQPEVSVGGRVFKFNPKESLVKNIHNFTKAHNKNSWSVSQSLFALIFPQAHASRAARLAAKGLIASSFIIYPITVFMEGMKGSATVTGPASCFINSLHSSKPSEDLYKSFVEVKYPSIEHCDSKPITLLLTSKDDKNTEKVIKFKKRHLRKGFQVSDSQRISAVDVKRIVEFCKDPKRQEKILAQKQAINQGTFSVTETTHNTGGIQ